MAHATADVIVAGAGTMGSMALWRLASRGASVIALEQFAPGHDRGSGHGESRMIRTAYFEGPEYVPLVRSAFPLWRELEAETGLDLLTLTGALMTGPRDGELVGGALRSARVWERDAGVLRPERAIQAAADRAVALGATLVTGGRIVGIEAAEGRVAVRTGEADYRARHLVVCVGPWLGGLLPVLGLPLAVERQVMTWFPASDPGQFAPELFPVFIREREGAIGYGLPSLDGATVKVALHHGGRPADPDALDRQVTAADVAPVAALVAETLPGLAACPSRSAVCMYTNTPDELFVIGPAPALPGVTVLGGFSGHGFKFAPVMGDVAADLALDGRTGHPIERFSPARFA